MSYKTVNLFKGKIIPSVQLKREKAQNRFDEKMNAYQSAYEEYTKDMTEDEKESFAHNLSANGDTFESYLKAKALRLEREKNKKEEVKEESEEEYECPNCSYGKYKISCLDCGPGQKFKPDPNELIRVGKYKGKTSHDIFEKDYKYCQWMYKNVDKCPRYLKYVFNNVRV